ncbi:Zn-dependent dipeptidase, microsomal dipeptidase [Aquisphaera insulae]|uniref:Zn-dependent dipeptidase, microsomal dipeptidase n=1 Tax=Aquisphaera insulae TaxID=2712864 RepID=UPI0013EB8D87|nr:Zn-dependent dipeptidase, microsomal dipeptidase [Aquisphaera insulae]
MRLVDLRCDWSLQYATESVQYDPALYPEIPGRLARLDGYLTTVRAAILPCRRSRPDWAKQPDRWQALDAMLARHEAEFSGRLLIGPDDVARWDSQPDDFLCWGLLGLADLDLMVREESDLTRLEPLFERGVRVFQLVAEEWSPSLLLRTIEALGGLAGGQEGPRPVIDVAGMKAEAAAGVLDWYQSDEVRRRLLLVHSHGEPSLDLERFRALGGLVGVGVSTSFAATADDLAARIEAIAAIPFRGKPGFEGIAIATDFLGIEEVIAPLETAERVLEWLTGRFGEREAAMLSRANAEALLRDSAGARPS